MSDWEEDMYDDDEEEEELSFEEDDPDDDDDDDDDNNMNDINDTGDNDDNITRKKTKCIDLESLYFQAKNLKEEDNLSEALLLFNKIISYDNSSNDYDSSNYQFKSIKQSIKIYEGNRNLTDILALIDKLLEMKSNKNINPSYFNFSLLKIVNRIDRGNYDSNFTISVFLKFDDYLKNLSNDQQNEISNKKLMFKIQLGISNCYINMGDEKNASKILTVLENIILKLSNDSFKTAYHLDILATKILLLLNISDFNTNLLELKRLTENAHKLISGIPQSKILGIINEGSGLVSMYSNDYYTANNYFQVSFKSFNDCGDKRRIDVLIKFILSSLLSKSEVNPFNSSEFQGFTKLNFIKTLIEVYNCFQNINNTNLKKFNNLLKSNEFTELTNGYKFVKDFKYSLKDLFFMDYIIKQLSLFEKVKFDYFLSKLDILSNEFEKLLIKIFNKGLLSNYKIDYIDKIIIQLPNESFINIKTSKFLKNSFMYYQLTSSNSFEEFKIQLDSLSQLNDQLSKKNIKDFPELMELDFEDIEKVKYFDINEKHEENSTVNNEDCSLVAPLNNNTNININKLRFETIFNVETLQKISMLLYNDNFIKKDLINDSQISSKLLSCIDQYINLIETSIPLNINKDISYFDKVKDEKINNEFKKMFNISESKLKSLQNDDNIPDVIQTTTMNQLEPPSNPDLKNDPDLLLKGNEKKLQRLKQIQTSIDIVTKKNRELRIRTTNFLTSVDRCNDEEGEQEYGIHENDEIQKQRSGFNRIMLNRLFHRQTMSTDQSETTSLGDNMSFDGGEDYREDF
ncbi:hypothetical protein C6P42_005033 [Pichia californica]|nr:hypothetical protein C6P42_005033 [[Candida] californica]